MHEEERYISYGVRRLYIGVGGAGGGSGVKSTGRSSREPEFDFQQPHGDSQPSIVGSDTLFWNKGVHADRELLHLK